MDKSFEDGIRRAAGLPTDAEIESARMDQTKATQALADDQPRRRALVSEFQDTIAPVIDQMFKRAAATLETPDADVELGGSVVFPSSSVLAEKAYEMKWRPPPQPVNRFHHQRRILIAPLCFKLLPSGQVLAFAPDIASAPPTLSVRISGHTGAMKEFTSERVGGIFTEYVKAAVQVIRLARQGH